MIERNRCEVVLRRNQNPPKHQTRERMWQYQERWTNRARPRWSLRYRRSFASIRPAAVWVGMLFNSFEFIFGFLPITLAGFLLIGKVSGANRPRRLASVGVTRILRVLERRLSSDHRRLDCRKFFFRGGDRGGAARISPDICVAVAANLVALGFYKYGNFAIEIYNAVAPHPFSPLAVTLPLGISFFTFTQIAYLADVLWQAYERNFVKYVLFVTYFPHLIAGPILHHREMMPQFDVAKPPRLSTDRLAIGLTIFVVGLFKKAVIADYLSTIADPVFAAAAKGAISRTEAWGGALAYSLQIYFDFSGYCDMAIGISFLFGIVLPFNFDAPYKSRSITEFWHRWHITLSRFLRDYLYIPLGGNRRGEVRRNSNLAATMVIGGLWHGAGFTFIIWGALHGLFLIVNHTWLKLRKRSSVLARAADTSVYALASLALTQLCVVVAWIFFRADSLHTARIMLSAMSGNTAASGQGLLSAVNFGVVIAGYVTCLIMPNVNEMFLRENVGLDTYHLPRPWSIVQLHWTMRVQWAIATAAAFVVAIVAILAAGDGSPFLYFQF